MLYVNLFTYTLLTLVLGWYLITNLQWYNYRIERVIFKHHKIQWHIIYFLTPCFLFYWLEPLYFSLYFYLLYVTSFVIWYRKLDKPLVLTYRVKRFLGLLMGITVSVNLLCFLHPLCEHFAVLVPLVLTYAMSSLIEKLFFMTFKHKAKQRLRERKNLKIIAITASYGKTSIKNYLYQVLSRYYRTYKTPRSVNTLAGIVLDINKSLPLDSEIYIVEAGARLKGDIKEIAHFLEHQYAIIGTVGEQHIEYFKTLDNIIYTKMELLQSPKLNKGFVHESVPILDYPTIEKFPSGLTITMSNLDGIWFDLEINGELEHFHAPLLGSFSATNLVAVILCSLEFGLKIDDIKLALHDLEPVEHRLQLIKQNGKIIIDDSFNGNLEGMLEAITISSTYQGRKVMVTPGLVESTQEANTTLALAIDKVFDVVILTGQLNLTVLSKHIDSSKVVILKDKHKMQETLSRITQMGDLILFANDAPNFI